jgi:hypothetical protein
MFSCVLLVCASPAAADRLWDHNGSIIRLEARGASRRMIYDLPRPDLPVRKGQRLFEGMRNGSAYTGKASIFSNTCGEARYAVTGTVSSDEHEIILRGRAPRRNKDCSIVGYRDDELVFNLRPDSIDATITEPTPGSQPVTPTELAQATESLSLSFAIPLPPVTRKEVHDGVMLFYNAKTSTQRFEGDANQLRFTLDEHFVQRGIGGDFDDNNHWTERLRRRWRSLSGRG